MDDYDYDKGVVIFRVEIYFFSYEYGGKYIVFVQECENWAKLIAKKVILFILLRSGTKWIQFQSKIIVYFRSNKSFINYIIPIGGRGGIQKDDGGWYKGRWGSNKALKICHILWAAPYNRATHILKQFCLSLIKLILLVAGITTWANKFIEKNFIIEIV